MGRKLQILAAAILVLSLTYGWAAGADKEQKVTITLKDFSFTPARITLRAGTSAEIILLNKGKVQHEF